MPQISPMKWLILNFITQSTIMQINSFVNHKKNFNLNSDCIIFSINKMCWKW